MDQLKFVKVSVKKIKADHTPSNFLKAVFHKFYLVHSWILCRISSSPDIITFQKDTSYFTYIIFEKYSKINDWSIQWWKLASLLQKKSKEHVKQKKSR